MDLRAILQRTIDYPWNGYFLLLLGLAIFLLLIYFFFSLLLLIMEEMGYTSIYDYSPFKDTIFPLFLIFLSPFLWLGWGPSWQSSSFFLGLLFLHILIIIPLLFHWGKNRQWFSLWENGAFLPSGKSLFFWDLSWALIYPYVWGLYFSWLRFSRLGGDPHSLFLFSISSWDYSPLFPFLFLLPYTLSWLYLFFLGLGRLRKFLWQRFSSFYLSFHLLLLQNLFYFSSLEKLFKFNFLFHAFFLRNYPLYDEYPLSFAASWGKRIYKYPSFFTLILFTFLLLDFSLRHSTTSLFTFLFLYPILWSIFSLFYSLGSSDWPLQVCLSDYLYGNWEKVRYPLKFWYFFRDPLFFYGRKKYISQEKEIFWQEYGQKKIWHLRRIPGGQKAHSYQLFRRSSSRSFGHRLALSFRLIHEIRWIHQHSLPKHPLSSYLTSFFWDRMALIHENWSNYAHVLRAEKFSPSSPFPENIYVFPWMNVGVSPNVTNFIEKNTLTFFQPLVEKKVSVETFHGQKLDSSTQAEPDLVAGFSSSIFSEKRTLGLDMKNKKKIGLGFSHLLPLEKERYIHLLSSIIRHQERSGFPLNADQMEAYVRLISSVENFSFHQEVWASSVHLFPGENIPPLWLPHHFNLEHLNPSCKDVFRHSQWRMERISDFLYARKVTSDPRLFTEKIINFLREEETVRKILSSPPGGI